MNWFKQNWTLIALIAIGAWFGRSCFPKVEQVGRVVPQIITKYDTVRTRWIVHDTIHHFTTDTFNLVVSQTLYDTVVINVRDTSERLWPVVRFEQQGDTAWLRTFELSTGRGSILRVYAPGPVSGIYADSLAMPRMNFGVWPRQHVPMLTKLAYAGGGFGVCTLLNMANDLTR